MALRFLTVNLFWGYSCVCEAFCQVCELGLCYFLYGVPTFAWLVLFVFPPLLIKHSLHVLVWSKRKPSKNFCLAICWVKECPLETDVLKPHMEYLTGPSIPIYTFWKGCYPFPKGASPTSIFLYMCDVPTASPQHIASSLWSLNTLCLWTVALYRFTLPWCLGMTTYALKWFCFLLILMLDVKLITSALLRRQCCVFVLAVGGLDWAAVTC